DGPIYLIVLVAAEGLRRVIANGGRLLGSDWRGLAWLRVQLLLLAGVFFLPFLVAFRSQAAGIAPHLLNPTIPGEFFLVFGPFILLIAPFLLLEARRAGNTMNWGGGIRLGLLILVGLIALMLLLSLLGFLIPSIQAEVEGFVQANGGWVSTAVATFAK